MTRWATAALIAGAVVAGAAYLYLQIAQIPFGLPDPDSPSYAQYHPVRWRVLWVTINIASALSALGFVGILLARLR